MPTQEQMFRVEHLAYSPTSRVARASRASHRMKLVLDDGARIRKARPALLNRNTIIANSEMLGVAVGEGLLRVTDPWGQIMSVDNILQLQDPDQLSNEPIVDPVVPPMEETDHPDEDNKESFISDNKVETIPAVQEDPVTQVPEVTEPVTTAESEAPETVGSEDDQMTVKEPETQSKKKSSRRKKRGS